MFRVTFPISKVTTFVLLPPLVTFVLAYFGAMAGVTGAFLLLPFQMSILGYIAPGVSATNFVYNIIAIPGTVFRYIREGRMNWPLAMVISVGSLPGIIVGYMIRVRYLTDPRYFKAFVGFVLLYLAWLMARSLLQGKKKKVLPAVDARIKCTAISLKRIAYMFDEKEHSFDPRVLFPVALAVGTAGGAYGIGGGAVLAPFCISVLRLPVHSVAGASLFCTFVSSVVGVCVYQFGFFAGGLDTGADYLLGALFGIGGLFGGYLGAKTQKYIPEKPIKIGLLLVLVVVAFRYLYVLVR
jgi:hypothetical protein